MFRLFGGHYSRSSSRLDTAESVLLAWENVPCLILVRTNVVDDLVPCSVVDVIKGGLVSTPDTVCVLQWGRNRHILVKIALAEIENLVLP